MEYKIVKGESIVELELCVKKLLVAGWKLQGGVCVVNYPSTIQIKFYQAMVKPIQSTP
jgi:hypothetical protein